MFLAQTSAVAKMRKGNLLWKEKNRPRKAKDTLAERLRRRPAKPMGSPRVGSNPTGVDLFPRLWLCQVSHGCVISIVPWHTCTPEAAASFENVPAKAKKHGPTRA